MSRIGNKQIYIDGDVSVTLSDKALKVSGPKGILEKEIPSGIEVDISDGIVSVRRKSEDKRTKALHGLTRALINNMVVGVKDGFQKTLEINGTGYKCDIKSKSELVLNLGYSHPVTFDLPSSITAEVENKGTQLKISGIDKELVGEISAQIRKLRKPERYKGKGIRYTDEHIRLKAGKAGGAKGND
jgi:large subunit ribosomal protein L6